MSAATSTFASVDETARRRFESAWRDGCPPSIADHLPPVDDPRYQATLEELVHIDLEMGWKARGRNEPGPRVENYLTRFPQLDEPAMLLRLAQQEYRVRHKYGDRPAVAEFASRFPAIVTAGTIAEPPRDDNPPVVPGYEALELLGRGGMGIVYKARQIQLDRSVALKMIRFGDASPEELARFRTEAATAAQLQHPNIVQVYEVGEAGGRPYLVMEFVPGSTLDKVLAGTPQPPALAAAIVVVLARAIHAAHLAGVIHRDLKPANVLLSTAGSGRRRAEPEAATGSFHGPHSDLRTLKIADFGLAKRLQTDSGQTQTGMVIGTPSYMSPEQAAGRKDVGPAADVWALGAILYECLTGRPPFRAASSWDTISQVLKDNPIPPSRFQSRLPRDIETICLKCLEKEPARRYASAEALADDLDRFIAGRSIAARPVRLPERAWRWCRRESRTAGLIAAVVMVLILGAGVAGGLWLRMERQTDSRFDADLRAIDDEMSFIDREEFALTPQMDEARRQFLENLGRKCRNLTEQKADNPALRRKKADVHDRLGTIDELLGRYETAETAYREAITLRTGLPDRDRGPDGDRALAACHHLLANLLRVTGRFAEAEEQYRQAVARVSRTDDKNLQGVLAETLHDSGRLQVLIGQLDGGEASFRRALILQLQLVSERPTDAKVQLTAAAIETSLSNLLVDLSRFDESAKLLDSAVGRQDKLAKDAPTVPVYRLGLGRSLNARGRRFEVLDREPESVKDKLRAFEIFQKLAAENPHRPDYRNELAAAHHNVARVPLEPADPAHYVQNITRMEQMYRDAVDLQGRLVAEYPAILVHHQRLAISLNTLATWLNDKTSEAENPEQSAREVTEALALHERSEAIWVRLERDYQVVPAYKSGLATSHQRHGIVLERTKKLDEAEDRYRQSIAIHEALVERFPTMIRYRLTLGALRNNLGVIHDRRGEIDGAEREFRAAAAHTVHARKLNPAYNVPRHLLSIQQENVASILLRRGGHYQEAAELANQYGRLHPQGYWNYNRVFRRLTECMAQAEKDANLSPDVRKELLDRYGVWMVEHVRLMAAEAAVVKVHMAREVLYHLKQPVLDPVRNRSDFQQIYKDFESRDAAETAKKP